MRAIPLAVTCVVLIATVGRLQAGLIFDDSVSNLITVTWDETFTITTDNGSLPREYLFLIVEDTYLVDDGAGLLNEIVTASQTVSVNSGPAISVGNWHGWQYRPGDEFTYSSLDTTFGLTTSSLPAFNGGDSLRWVGSMTVNNSGSVFRMPDLDSGATTSAYLANIDGQFSDTISTTVSTTAAVPEPSSLGLVGIGGLGMFGYGWRRKRKRRLAV